MKQMVGPNVVKPIESLLVPIATGNSGQVREIIQSEFRTCHGSLSIRFPCATPDDFPVQRFLIVLRVFIMKRNTVSNESRPLRGSVEKKIQACGGGIGQLTLVEHSLCPLDARASLQPGLRHRSSFQYSDAQRRRKTAIVEVSCPQGLSAMMNSTCGDCWLLTLNQPQPIPEFHATPHYCLRQLGLVDTNARRGGRQYQQFAAAIERLSWVKYGCDAFYDPVRAEHCRVRFSFFSYRPATGPKFQSRMAIPLGSAVL
jgi:hypothetical protein